MFINVLKKIGNGVLFGIGILSVTVIFDVFYFSKRNPTYVTIENDDSELFSVQEFHLNRLGNNLTVTGEISAESFDNVVLMNVGVNILLDGVFLEYCYGETVNVATNGNWLFEADCSISRENFEQPYEAQVFIRRVKYKY